MFEMEMLLINCRTVIATKRRGICRAHVHRSNGAKAIPWAALILLPFVAAFVTGCPSTEYKVEMTPRGNLLERKLTFYRADGTNSNGVPNYQSIPSNQVTATLLHYPSTGVRLEGERHYGTGAFAGRLPTDVGGFGYFTNISNSLGSAGVYSERFRGDDDIASRVAKQAQAADKFTDLIIGWSSMELGREPNYKNLRRFLDTELRRDLKNAALYFWLGGITTTHRTNGGEEFLVRFGQFLVEHDYVKASDLPDVFRAAGMNDEAAYGRLMQRFFARKLGVLESRPIPQSLSFLADMSKQQQSFEKYLATTAEYRAILQDWKRKELRATYFNSGFLWQRLGNLTGSNTNATTTSSNLPPRPEPSVVMDGVIEQMLVFDLFQTRDTVSVSLALPSQPLHSNGTWDPTNNRVVWNHSLEQGTNSSPLPAFCYASWSEPNFLFQREHFGDVIVSGDALHVYCLWRDGLDTKSAGEWDAMLLNLKGGEKLKETLDAFRFSSPQTGTNASAQGMNAVDYGRELIKKAHEEKSSAVSK